MLFDPRWEKPPVTVRDVLLQTAEFLERNEWGRAPAIYARPQTVYCAVTALAAVGQSHERTWAATEVLERHIGGSVVEWNDAPARTKAEVINAMRLAAWRNDGAP